jgi:hypothetical protein
VRMLEELGRLDPLLVAPVSHRLLDLCAGEKEDQSAERGRGKATAECNEA